MSRTPLTKGKLLAIAAAHVTITAATWRDLARRPASRIRGSKTLWRVLSTANTSGSVGYWLFGRRRSEH